ncbi:hypothetical protein V4U87_10075 [Methanobrevibacter gottschalkii]
MVSDPLVRELLLEVVGEGEHTNGPVTTVPILPVVLGETAKATEPVDGLDVDEIPGKGACHT